MPLYEYACKDCRCDFEVLIRRDEKPVCPKCGGKRLVKQLSVVAAHSARDRSLPQCGSPVPGGCGLADCSSGRCPLD